MTAPAPVPMGYNNMQPRYSPYPSPNPVNPNQLSQNYGITRQHIDSHAEQLFFKYDHNRNGSLDTNELRSVLMEFTALNGLPPIRENDMFVLISLFDVDRSGSIDFWEFKMMLKYLGGLKTYDQNIVIMKKQKHKKYKHKGFKKFKAKKAFKKKCVIF